MRTVKKCIIFIAVILLLLAAAETKTVFAGATAGGGNVWNTPVNGNVPGEGSDNAKLAYLRLIGPEGKEIPLTDNGHDIWTAAEETAGPVTIEAAAEDPKASVEGTGQFELKEGGNSFDVVVTAENGIRIGYRINVQKPVTADGAANAGETAKTDAAPKPDRSKWILIGEGVIILILLIVLILVILKKNRGGRNERRMPRPEYYDPEPEEDVPDVLEPLDTKLRKMERERRSEAKPDPETETREKVQSIFDEKGSSGPGGEGVSSLTDALDFVDVDDPRRAKKDLTHILNMVDVEDPRREKKDLTHILKMVDYEEEPESRRGLTEILKMVDVEDPRKEKKDLTNLLDIVDYEEEPKSKRGLTEILDVIEYGPEDKKRR